MKGLRPLPYDARDFDLHKTFGATAAPSFPENYSVENGLWCPDQNRGGEVFNLPPMPFGCTDYAQADLCADDDRELKNPLLLETVTRANARGGIDMRESLAAAKAVFGRTAYFRVTPTYPLDFFDAIRLAMLSTRDEGRSVSVGTPWYPAWDDPHRGGILPVPPSFATGGLGWHNWKVAGWKTIGGAPYLVCKMWAGPSYGDHGFVYMSRELANAVLNIGGAAAYTLTKVKPSDIQTVDFEFVKWVVGYIRRLFKVDEPAPATALVTAQDAPQRTQTPEPAPAPAPAPHGDEKLIAALIQVESRGNDNAVGDKNLANHAYGCLQIRKPYVDDANGYLGTSYKAQDCLGNRALSIKIFRAYMARYKLATDEQKARAHNGGPSAARPGTKMHAATDGYWAKVKALL